MIVKEMHVDVQAQLQRLAGNVNRKLRDDQIDWYLNSTQQSMVEAALEPAPGSGRIQIKPNMSEIVNGLLSGRTTIPTAWDTDKYISFLPPDFWYLLDDGSQVVQLCKGDSKVISYTILNITSVSFPLSPATSNFYNSLNLIYNNNSLINLSTILAQRQKQWTGTASREEHFYIRTLLQSLLWDKGIQVYWEQFAGINQPYTLLFVSASTSVPITLSLDGVDYPGTTQQLTLETHTGTRVSTLTPNTMISSDKGIATGSTPYFRTSYISPTSEQGPSVIYTYTDKSFIVCSTVINYIRKPRSISLTLGTDCQLSPAVHQRLCNKTTEVILNRIAAGEPNWQEVTKQNAVTQQS